MTNAVSVAMTVPQPMLAGLTHCCIRYNAAGNEQAAQGTRNGQRGRARILQLA